MDGIISFTLKALSLQLAGLMDEAGGDRAIKLLDALASLNPQARAEMLDKFNVMLSEAQKSDNNGYVPGVEEERLFKSILDEVEDGSIFTGKKFQVLSGPQPQEHLADIIDMQEYRRRMRH